jgi:hypothetical protein
MEKNFTQQEILLVTGSQFSSRQLIDRMDSPSAGPQNEKELLEEACWYGLLNDILPEICIKRDPMHRLWLWKVMQAQSFIEIDLGEFPEAKDRYMTIDPYTCTALGALN